MPSTARIRWGVALSFYRTFLTYAASETCRGCPPAMLQQSFPGVKNSFCERAGSSSLPGSDRYTWCEWALAFAIACAGVSASEVRCNRPAHVSLAVWSSGMIFA